MMASATLAVLGYPRRRYRRAAVESASGAVNACMVLKCATSDGAGLTMGAISVLNTSMREWAWPCLSSNWDGLKRPFRI